MDQPIEKLLAYEIDRESIAFLKDKIKAKKLSVIEEDFLKKKWAAHEQVSVIGNFPYNISSQIFFNVLEGRDQVDQVVCMLQKEVAVRIASGPGKKVYGILSVLLQLFYDIEYLFDVPPEVFNPPPKVVSGVIRLKRNDFKLSDKEFKSVKKVVKQGFNNRRKTLRNALKSLILQPEKVEQYLGKRAEELSCHDFLDLTNLLENDERN